jgi:capsular exopolysaccharide synthesis family protein
VISVTSCDSHDGKSTVSLEVAKSLAYAGKRVLYIDADMRKSVFAAKNTDEREIIGLSHFLSGQNSLDESLCSTNVPGLFVVFSGAYPPNPAELLSSSMFSRFIKDSREQFDYVIIDTPPLGLVSDAAVCVAQSDGAIIIISSERTRLRNARDVKKAIERTGTKIIGCVVNNIKVSNNKYYYYKKYKY